MDQGKPSRTALRAAVSRAIHQLIDEEPKILTDPVAVRLTEASAPGAIEEGMKTFSPPERPGSRALFVLRSRFAEDELAVAATQGIGQYVILGAGLDTFAYRQPPYAGALNIFEVDHPSTQQWKRESLAAADIPLPSNLSGRPSTSSARRSRSSWRPPASTARDQPASPGWAWCSTSRSPPSRTHCASWPGSPQARSC